MPGNERQIFAVHSSHNGVNVRSTELLKKKQRVKGPGIVEVMRAHFAIDMSSGAIGARMVGP